MRLLAISLILLAAPARGQSPGLGERIDAIVPAAEEERWLQIPWRTELLEARREANAAGKPIFMWLMNGDPLGCT